MITGTMFTSLELQYFTLTFKYFSKITTSSFKFKDGELLADKRKIKVFFLYVKLFLWALNIAVLLSKIPSTLAIKNFQHIIMIVMEIAVPVGSSLYPLCIVLYQDEILALVKQTLVFNRKFGE
jgi:hypothetical protein